MQAAGLARPEGGTPQVQVRHGVWTRQAEGGLEGGRHHSCPWWAWEEKEKFQGTQGLVLGISLFCNLGQVTILYRKEEKNFF